MKKQTKRRLLLLLAVMGFLFLASGCTAPVDKETGKIILITSDTTFKSIMAAESWFSAFFVFPLAKAINWLTPFIGVAGGIAVITLGVNLLTLVFTIKSTVASQRMQTIQPEMNKINAKYAGKTDERSKMAMAQEMQNLYKKYDINPFGAILVSFIQLPVLMAIYLAVQRAEAVTHGSLFGLSLEISPLTGIMNGQWLYLVIFIVMAAAQLASIKLPTWLANNKAKKEGKKKDAAQMPGGNSMLWMMGFMMILSINWPAAMTIYWMISSLTMIGKTLFIQYFYIDKKPEGK